MTTTSTRLAACLITAAAATALTATGCYTQSPPGWSGASHTYESTPWRPQTVSLIDTRTGETLWTTEVPVGQKLIVSFDPGRGPNPNYPDVLVWGTVDADKIGGRFQQNRQAAPPEDARRLDVQYRDAPEFVDRAVSN